MPSRALRCFRFRWTRKQTIPWAPGYLQAMPCCTWNLCDGRHSIVHLCSPLAALRALDVSAGPYSKPVSCCGYPDTRESEDL